MGGRMGKLRAAPHGAGRPARSSGTQAMANPERKTGGRLRLAIGGAAMGGAILALGAVAPAAAATMTYDVTFAATDFQWYDNSPPPAPVPLALGHFTITLDPTQSHSTPTTSGLAVDFVNLNLDFPLQWVYQDYGGSQTGQGNLFVFGHDVFTQGTNDMLLALKGFGGTSPGLLELVYIQGTDTTYAAQLGTVHVKEIAPTALATTPIPAALPLFVSALGGLGLFGWRRRRSAA